MDIVNVPNRLICARYRMSLRAFRLRDLALMKLTCWNYLFGIAPPITVTAREWQNFYMDSEQPYRDLKIASTDFEKVDVIFRGESCCYKFLDSIQYIPGEGKVVLEFNSDFLKACVNIESTKLKIADPSAISENV